MTTPPEKTFSWIFKAHMNTFDMTKEALQLELKSLKKEFRELQNEQKLWKRFFDEVPAPLYESDCSRLKHRLDDIASSYKGDLTEYFKKKPEDLFACADMIRVTEVNTAGFQVMGAENREQFFINLHRVFTEELIETVLKGFIPIHSGASNSELEITTTNLKGKPQHLKLNIRPMPGCRKDWKWVLTSVTDITGLKEKEQKLKKFSSALEQNISAVIITGRDGTIEYVNPAFTTLTGYTLEEAVGKNPRFLNSGRQSNEFYRGLWKTILSGGCWKGEFYNRKKNGELYCEKSSITPIMDEKGAIKNFVAIKEDITEMKRMEHALKEEKEKFKALIDSSDEGVLAYDMEMRYTTWNPAMERLTGRSAGEVIGKRPMDIFPFLEEVGGLEACRAALKGIPTRMTAARPYTIPETGKKGYFLNRHFPLYGAKGNLRGGMCLVRDVTEARKHEEEKERILIRSLKSQKAEALGALAGGIAHDFNNILTVIKSLSDILSVKVGKSSPLREYVDPIRESTAMAIKLVEQLGYFSSGKESAPVITNVNSVVNGLLSMLKRLIREDIQIETHLDNGLWNIKIDGVKLEQVITNLVINAGEALSTGGRIIIRTSNIAAVEKDPAAQEPDEFICLTIEDNGTGMEKDLMEHIFDPFFSTKDRPGTGMGLAVVHGIVKEYGGRIDVSSEIGSGTVFRIYFPASNDAVSMDGDTRATRKNKSMNRILLVEDEPLVLKSTAMMLSERGYTVFEAGDAQEAMKILNNEKWRFALVLSDVVMPGKSGIILREEIHSAVPDLPVLLFSGHLSNEMEMEWILSKNIPFIRKPFETNELFYMITGLVKSRGGNPGVNNMN